MWDFKFPEKKTKPHYLYVADKLEEDILSGCYKSGDRLMTYRDLASKTGVTVGTIRKAYVEAERRGLIAKHVGRGTFVLDHSLPDSNHPDLEDSGIIDLGSIMSLSGMDPSIKPILQRVLEGGMADSLMVNLPPLGRKQHREIGASWLRWAGVEATGDSVLIANGLQHALCSMVQGLLQSGDGIGVAQFTNPGFSMLLQRHGASLVGIKQDDDGMDPAHLDELCQKKQIKAILMAENPPCLSVKRITDKRRNELCEIIAKHGLFVFEDGSLNWLGTEKKSTYTSMLPEQSVYYADIGLSSFIGLRVAFIHAPEHFHTRIAQILLENSWSSPPLCVALACEAIKDGSVKQSMKNKTKELARRIALVREVMGEFNVICSEDSIYAWLCLPDTIPSREFEQLAERQGIRVFSADRFVVGQFTAPNCVRISVVGPKDLNSLNRGLKALVALAKKDSRLVTPIW